MIRGLYTSASGMLAMQNQTEIIAENVANVKTPGYIEQEGSPMSFQVMLMNRISTLPNKVEESTPIGPMGTGVYMGAITKIDRTPELVPGGPTDFALDSPGYFVIQTPDGLAYTRKGEFMLTEQGDLITREGNPVMGENGPITGLTEEFRAQQAGALEVDGAVVDNLLVVNIPLDNLRQVGDALYIIDEDIQPELAPEVNIRQGMLEGSNVDISGQMAKLIKATRAYEANQKVIQTQDSTLDKAVNEIGKVY